MKIPSWLSTFIFIVSLSVTVGTSAAAETPSCQQLYDLWQSAPVHRAAAFSPKRAGKQACDFSTFGPVN